MKNMSEKSAAEELGEAIEELKQTILLEVPAWVYKLLDWCTEKLRRFEG